MNLTDKKFIILVGDGMADYRFEELDGRSPLEAANTPNMDRIAACRIGLARTIPEGMEPGSDIANLSILGYDPKTYHTGRAPLEAVSMGVELGEDQVAFRMNLVTLDHRSDQEIIMVSHSSGDIGDEEAKEIVESVKDRITTPDISIYPGVAYRHLLVWEKGPQDSETIPPHDFLDRNMADYLNHDSSDPITEIIRLSWPLLKSHPVNRKRRENGLLEANSIWLWGQGKTPALPLFKDKYSLNGGVISAVDLLKGTGIYAGLIPIHVQGATGYLDTNYIGKAENAVKGLEKLDFVFVHVEAPDEASHNGSLDEKIQAIEDFDRKVVGTVLEGLIKFSDYNVMVISDHYTPISKRTHTSEPAPFAWATKNELDTSGEGAAFTEKNAMESGLIFEKGHELMDSFLSS